MVIIAIIQNQSLYYHEIEREKQNDLIVMSFIIILVSFMLDWVSIIHLENRRCPHFVDDSTMYANYYDVKHEIHVHKHCINGLQVAKSGICVHLC